MKINNNKTLRTKWQELALDINKTEIILNKSQNTKNTRLETNIMNQSPWFLRKVQPEPSSRFHGNLSSPCNPMHHFSINT